MSWDRDDCELQLVREFQHSGEPSWLGLTKSDRARRCRRAIYQHGRENLPFYGSGILSYAEAFRFVYGAPLEQRSFDRPQVPAFSEATLIGLDDDDAHDDDSP